MAATSGDGTPGCVSLGSYFAMTPSFRGAPWGASVSSDWIAPAVVLVVFVESALPRGDVTERFDEPDGLHPLYLLEAQLELVAQAKRGSMNLLQRLSVHLVREDGLRVVHVPDPVNVVKLPAALVRSVG